MQNKRPIHIVGDIAIIPLTQGYEAVIDAADLSLVEGFNWTADVVRRRKDGSVLTVYASRQHRLSNGKQMKIRLHRLLMAESNDMDVDHRDGNGLNNRRRGDTGNLRIVTSSQNMHNKRVSINNSSGVKGTYWEKTRSKWRALIAVDGRRHHLGYFDSKDEAAAAYARASDDLHGEYGRIN